MIKEKIDKLSDKLITSINNIRNLLNKYTTLEEKNQQMRKVICDLCLQRIKLTHEIVDLKAKNERLRNCNDSEKIKSILRK